MKITKRQLRRIINEEIRRSLIREQDVSPIVGADCDLVAAVATMTAVLPQIMAGLVDEFTIHMGQAALLCGFREDPNCLAEAAAEWFEEHSGQLEIPEDNAEAQAAMQCIMQHAGGTPLR